MDLQHYTNTVLTQALLQVQKMAGQQQEAAAAFDVDDFKGRSHDCTSDSEDVSLPQSRRRAGRKV